ncbi:MAG: transporter [Bacteroidetes bacterium]|nr:transporter [Bacteroidota bacterium]MCW5894166.1 transporter [Bacteroidota bacterium]
MAKLRGMRTTVASLLALLLLPSAGTACDFCNCLMGINPFYSSQNSIAVHFLYQQSHHASVLSDAGQDSDAPLLKAAPEGANHLHHGGTGFSGETREYRRTIELAYQHHLSEHILVTLLVPFSFVTVQSSTSLSIQGNGDATLTGQYVAVLDERAGSKFTLLFGGGVQLPTGRSNAKDKNGTLLDFRLQPGSASVGFVLTTSGFYQTESWVFAADIFGKMNRRNSAGSRLGNSLLATLLASRDILRDNPSLFALTASAGIRAEFTGQDILTGNKDPDSGAEVYYLNGGTELAYDFLRFDLRALVPLHQRRSGNAPQESTRFMAGLRVMF